MNISFKFIDDRYEVCRTCAKRFIVAGGGEANCNGGWCSQFDDDDDDDDNDYEWWCSQFDDDNDEEHKFVDGFYAYKSYHIFRGTDCLIVCCASCMSCLELHWRVMML